jgi:hypothetical protein
MIENLDSIAAAAMQALIPIYKQKQGDSIYIEKLVGEAYSIATEMIKHGTYVKSKIR